MKILRWFPAFLLLVSPVLAVQGSTTHPTKVAQSHHTKSTKNSSAAVESKCHCKALKRALKLNAAIDETFLLLEPSTAGQGAAAFASFFAENGVFQSPGGILRGKTAIFEGFRDYAENPGETGQRVIVRKTFWDPNTATLTVERTWFATLTAPRNFCGTVLNAGDTYSQDDVVVIRFACNKKCKGQCVLPGEVVYYREYFDNGQFEANFTSVYPLPCQKLD